MCLFLLPRRASHGLCWSCFCTVRKKCASCTFAESINMHACARAHTHTSRYRCWWRCHGWLPGKCIYFCFCWSLILLSRRFIVIAVPCRCLRVKTICPYYCSLFMQSDLLTMFLLQNGVHSAAVRWYTTWIIRIGFIQVAWSDAFLSSLNLMWRIQ